MCSRFCGAPVTPRVMRSIEEHGISAIRHAIAEYTSEPSDRPDPSPNVAPTDKVPVIHIRNGKQVVSLMSFSFTMTNREPVVNARCETLLEKSLFAPFAREKRCLIPARGFYEWDKTIKPRQPYCLRLANGEPFALAGIWREYVGSKQFVVITTEPNDLVRPLHDRMPCIVSAEDYTLWLAGDPIEALAKVCVPFPADQMTSFPVSSVMNKAGYKGEDSYKPIQLRRVDYGSLFDLD